MDETTTVQGREITKDDIELVRRLIRANPSWNRTRLSQELCLLWNWRAANGQIKDMACRSLLLKLEQRGHITLPGRRSPELPDQQHAVFDLALGQGAASGQPYPGKSR